nr:hypothetical protein [uncultured Methanobacterium sp.]
MEPSKYNKLKVQVNGGFGFFIYGIPDFSSIRIPGVPAGSLDMDNNIVGWVDSPIFGPSHLLDEGFDPKGLIAVINGTAMVLLGLVLVGP